MEQRRHARNIVASGLLTLDASRSAFGAATPGLAGLGIFVGALTECGFGMLTAAVALTAAAVLMILLNILNLRETYEAIYWTVIVLLGGMIPVGGVFESAGTAIFCLFGLFWPLFWC